MRDEEKTNIQSVAAMLRDPDSAMFRGEMLAKRGAEGLVEVCGTVQARNGFGGYAQGEPFYVSMVGGKITDTIVGQQNAAGGFHTGASWHCLTF